MTEAPGASAVSLWARKIAEARAHAPQTGPAVGAEHRRIEEIAAADEFGDEAIARALIDRARTADLHDAALVHHRDLMRERQRFGLIMRHIDGGHAQLALKPLQLEAHALAQFGVEVGERLVEQQQAPAP